MINRLRGSTSSGGRFDAAMKLAVWNKGQIVPGVDPAKRRLDGCRAWIDWGQYGNTVETGWEIDHIQPVSKGGDDSLTNLQPLQWENNRHKSDDWPNWTCAKRS